MKLKMMQRIKIAMFLAFVILKKKDINFQDFWNIKTRNYWQFAAG